MAFGLKKAKRSQEAGRIEAASQPQESQQGGGTPPVSGPSSGDAGVSSSDRHWRRHVQRAINGAPDEGGNLPFLLKRYIEEVGKHRKWERGKVEEAKARSSVDPDKAQEVYKKIWLEEVKPQVDRQQATLRNAMKDNPSSTVFAIQSNGKTRVSVLDKGDVRSVLNGVLLQHVPLSEAGFAKKKRVRRRTRASHGMAK